MKNKFSMYSLIVTVIFSGISWGTLLFSSPNSSNTGRSSWSSHSGSGGNWGNGSGGSGHK